MLIDYGYFYALSLFKGVQFVLLDANYDHTRHESQIQAE